MTQYDEDRPDNAVDKTWTAYLEDELIGELYQEMVETAKQEITAFRSAGIFEKGPVWTDLWYRLGLRWTDSEPAYIEVPENAAKKFRELASEEKVAYDILILVLVQYMDADVFPPKPLKETLIQMIQGDLKRPKRRGRPPDIKIWARNFMIHYVAALLDSRYLEINPTRNAIGRDVAISDIIVHAVRDGFGTQVSIGTVQNILSDQALKQRFEEIRSLYYSSMLDDLP